MARVNIFDCDGVILDSKEAHWQYYSDFCSARKVNLKRRNFERAIRRESAFFWKNMKIPERLSRELNRDYPQNFGVNYPVKIFEGIPWLLEELVSKGIIVTMATFNRRENVERQLGEFISHFERVLTYEDGTKAEGIERIKEIYGKQNYRLIGDTCWDVNSAKKTEIDFVGINWGWQKFSKDSPFPVIQTLPDLRNYLVENN
jgi:phosphoglycolate phosphatase-like HAD superfamily hydrolase